MGGRENESWENWWLTTVESKRREVNGRVRKGGNSYRLRNGVSDKTGRVIPLEEQGTGITGWIDVENPEQTGLVLANQRTGPQKPGTVQDPGSGTRSIWKRDPK